MFAPTNQGIGFFLALMATFCWGAWPSARVKCNAEAPVFVLLYLVGQLTTAIFFCLTLGMIKGDDAVFNSTGFFDVLIQGADDHKLIITLGGFCYGNSDFIFAIVCSRLSFPVGFPIYAGTELILGTLLNYAILGSSANLTLLFLGLASAFCAILLMAVADLFELPSTKVESDIIPTNNAIVYNPLDTESPKCIELQSTPPAEEDSPRGNGSTKINIWVFVCFAAGCLSGSWSPLSSLGRSGVNGVSNPFVCYFIYTCGTFLSAPVLLAYYGRYFEDSVKRRNSIFSSYETYFYQLRILPMRDKLYGLLAGVLMGVGYFSYFISSAVLPTTVAFAIGVCCPLVTILIGVVTGEMAYSPWRKKIFMSLSATAYSGAIVLLTLSQVFRRNP